MSTPKKRSWLRTVVRVLLGLGLGLAATETIFHFRDHGAFPHLNIYVPDKKLGVRLRPLATEKLSFGGNPVTDIRINSDGYRGADWGPPADDEVLVVGDSQAFGLGVEEDETFSGVAAKELKLHVLDAGVPTYGPPELEAVMSEVLDKRKPKAVVYVVNFVNDPFEAKRPNVGRHAVWDGWAVRRELAPREVTYFPGRELLFRSSHAIFALRQFLYDKNGFTELRTPSEGGADDLVSLSAALENEQARAKQATIERNDAREAETRIAKLLAINADQRVKQIAFAQNKLESGVFSEGAVYLASGASPGDIVVPQLGEEGSPLGATAEYIQKAAKLRDKIERDLKERALANASDETSAGTLDALQRRDDLEKKLIALYAAPVEIIRATQPIVDAVLRAKKIAEEHGARFVLLALPMDVQISDKEWAKYGNEPRDMTQSLVLVRDLVDAVGEAGGTALDPTEALRGAEPGAFLDHDPHLSVKGHEVVGKMLAEALSGPPPKTRVGPLLSLPEGRSRLPKPDEWSKVGDLLVHGSDAAGCRTARIREWMLVRCTKTKTGTVPMNVRVLQGGHGDASTLANDGVVTLIAPVLRGDYFVAKFSWEDRSRLLTVEWPADLVETDRFLNDSKDPPDPPLPAASLEPLLACLKTLGKKSDAFMGYSDATCFSTYSTDCTNMVACAEGNPVAMPRCKDGQTNAGAALHCFSLCEKDADCTTGHCIDSQGAKLCIGP